MSIANGERERKKATVHAILTNGLPAMPSHLLRLNALLTAKPVDLKQVTALIRSDRNLEKHLFSAGNFAPSGVRRREERTEAAAILLGTHRLRTLIFNNYLMQLTENRLDERGMQEFRNQSLATGMLAERLGRALGYEAVERCYLAGLMHDAGKLPLLLAAKDDLEQGSIWQEGDDAHALRLERQTFGFDHCQAGRWLALHWKFELDLVEVLAAHHRPETARRDRALVGIVAAADHLCRKAEAGLPTSTADEFYFHCFPWMLQRDVEELVSLLVREYSLLRQEVELSGEHPLPAPLAGNEPQDPRLRV